MFHFGHLYSQWVARSGKLYPDLWGKGKDNNPLAITIVELGGSEKGKKGRKSTKDLIREFGELLLNSRKMGQLMDYFPKSPHLFHEDHLLEHEGPQKPR